MSKLTQLWKVIILDALGFMLLIAAVLTGWLPGPGGIPLFLIGLSLLAINHTWAQRYIDIIKKYADKLEGAVFVKNPSIQLLYDVISPCLIVVGIFLIADRRAVWVLSLGIFGIVTGITILLENRQRGHRLIQLFRR